MHNIYYFIIKVILKICKYYRKIKILILVLNSFNNPHLYYKRTPSCHFPILTLLLFNIDENRQCLLLFILYIFFQNTTKYLNLQYIKVDKCVCNETG